MRTRSLARPFAAAALVASLLLAAPALAQVELPDTPPFVNAGVPFQPIATVYAEDFELTDGGYVADGNASWEWGQPSVHVQPEVGQGPNVWGTNLAGAYANRACGSITSPAIALPAGAGASTPVSAARVVFRHWMQAEDQWDGGVLQASANGADWTVLQPVGGYDDRMISSTVRACLGVVSGEFVFTGPSGSALPAGDEWQDEAFDLTPYLGGAVQLRWVFAADTSDVRLGWYIDDVVVQLGAGAHQRVDIPRVDPVAGVAFTPVADLYAEDFEASEGGWVASGTGAWEWGEATAPPLPPLGSLNGWGTRLASDYLPDECAYLTSPEILLPGASADAGIEAARLTTQVWRHLRSGYDGAQLQVTTDGGATWAALTPAAGYDRTLLSTADTTAVRACLGIGTADRVWSGPSGEPKPEDWKDVVVDLTPYLGSTIQLRIAFASGSTGMVERGIYLGDVLIQVGAGAAVDLEDPLPVLGGTTAPGWTIVGQDPSWEYGLAPASARAAWATSLDGNYHANECSAIVSPPVDTNLIPGLGRLHLGFEHLFESDVYDDGGVIQVSDDGGATWDHLTPIGGYTGTLDVDADACLGIAGTARGFTGAVAPFAWEPVEVPLSAYQGKTILIRFAFFADATIHMDGWTIRGIELSRGAGDVPLSLAVEAGAQGALDALSKIETTLLREEGPARAIVTGTPHASESLAALARVAGADRAGALATLDVLAAPFTDAVVSAVEAAGGEVLGIHPSAPAVSVVADAHTLALLAARDDVVYVAADSDESIHLVEPVKGTEEDAANEGVGAENSQGRQMLQAEEAWAAGFRGEGIALSIIDTGIDATHEAFRLADGSSRVAKWLDLVNGHPTPYDDQGHGTHVAGTAAGSAEYAHPTRGVYSEVGVAPKTTLYVAKFLNSGGSGSFTAAIDALEWSYEQGADITSNSWGSGCSSGSTSVIQAVRTLTDLGMLSVFAAGNSGPGSGTIGAPACGASALSVGAVGANGVIASFSSRGPCSDPEAGGGSRICPDVVAKGYLVNSAAASGGCSLCSPTGYIVLNGTSMATPHAAGAAVIAEQMKRSLTGVGWDTAARAEEEMFKLTSFDLGLAGEDNTYGWGLPQLMAVHAMLANTDEVDIVATFGISDALLRQGDAAQLTFAVRNLGGAVATGSFVTTLTRPDGSVATLRSTNVSLGLLDREAFSQAFTVTNDVVHGNYTFRGSFDYSWTNTTSGEVQTGSVLREGVIEVKRVQVQVALDGFAANALPGELQQVRYTATNVGNEDARSVVIEFSVPDDHHFVPGASFDPLDPNTRYADPAPDQVVESPSYSRVTLVFDVGNLSVGESFSFTTQLLPTVPGTYRVTSVAKYFDGANNAFSSGAARTQVVGLPPA